MSEDERFTSVIVDTNAFMVANSDFLGIKSSLLPSFFSVIKEKELKLLIHPIIEKEIEKHIEDSSLYRDYQNLKSDFHRCEEMVKLAGCDNKEIVSKICDCDIKQELFQAFKDNHFFLPLQREHCFYWCFQFCVLSLEAIIVRRT